MAIKSVTQHQESLFWGRNCNKTDDSHCAYSQQEHSSSTNWYRPCLPPSSLWGCVPASVPSPAAATSPRVCTHTHTHTQTCTSMHTTSKLSQTKKTNITSAATTSVILMTIYQVNFTWLSQLSLTCSRAEPTRDNWCRISTEHMVFLPPNHQHQST